jgi:Methyltransferase domain
VGRKACRRAQLKYKRERETSLPVPQLRQMRTFASCLAAFFVLAHSAEKCDFHTRLVEHLMEKRYQDEPDDLTNGGGERGNLWMQNNWEPSIRCTENRRVGHFGEGGKWICDPDCLLVPQHCTIFSVGSNNEFSFEESLQSHECQIFTFDHTTNGAAHPAFVHFSQVGIAPVSSGNLKSLPDLAAMVNVSTIDVFKIDCEGCEFAVFNDPSTLDFIEHHVKQILIEGALALSLIRLKAHLPISALQNG